MHRQGPKKRCGGFSMIELTCAIFIVTVGLLGIVTMHMRAMDRTHTMNEYAVASRAVMNEVETLRAQPFAALRPGRKLPFISETPETEKLVNATESVTIIEKSGGTPGLAEVRVNLRWTGENGRAIERSAVTLIAKKD